MKLRLHRNIALFDQHLVDLHVLEFNGVPFTTFNVPKAWSTGGDREMTARVALELRFTGAYTFTNARVSNDCAGTQTAPNVLSLRGHTLNNAEPPSYGVTLRSSF